MKGNSAVPGGQLTSKPTWSNTCGCSSTSAFFSLRNNPNRSHHHEWQTDVVKGRIKEAAGALTGNDELRTDDLTKKHCTASEDRSPPRH